MEIEGESSGDAPKRRSWTWSINLDGPREHMLVIAGMVVMAGLAGAYWLWFRVHFDQLPSDDPGRWGEFGDFVGGIVNPVIALFALYMLASSVHIQRTELKETRGILDEQRRLQEIQQFDERFFRVLELLMQHRARDGFEQASGALQTGVRDALQRSKGYAECRESYRAILLKHEHWWAPYVQQLQVLARLLAFASAKQLLDDAEIQRVYASAVRAGIGPKLGVVIRAMMLFGATGPELTELIIRYKFHHGGKHDIAQLLNQRLGEWKMLDVDPMTLQENTADEA